MSVHVLGKGWQRVVMWHGFAYEAMIFRFKVPVSFDEFQASKLCLLNLIFNNGELYILIKVSCGTNVLGLLSRVIESLFCTDVDIPIKDGL